MNSGFPSAVFSTRAVVAGPRPPGRGCGSTSRTPRRRAGLSTTVLGSRAFPPLQSGRCSSSSGRAMRTSRIGEPLRPLGEVLDEIEERGLRPVGVLDEEDQRAARGRAPRTGAAWPRRSRRDRPSAAPIASSRSSASASASLPPGTAVSLAAEVSVPTISRSGQKVIPSPYGTQRPTRTVASSSVRAHSELLRQPRLADPSRA